MLPEQCTKCLLEMKNESKAIHESIENQANKILRQATYNMSEQTTLHLSKQEEKIDKFLDKSDKRETRTSNIMITALVIFAGSLGYMFDKQARMDDRIDEKINRIDAITLTEAQMLREQGDNYYKAIFVRKPIVTGDTITYILSKKNIWSSVLRGAEKVKN